MAGLALIVWVALGVEGTASIAVMDFSAGNAGPQLASAASGVAANELQRLGVFRVISAESIRNLLAVERQKQLLGCSDDTSCSAELLGALGADYLVNGRLTKVGEGYTLELLLADTAKASRKASEVLTAKSEDELIRGVGKATLKLVKGLLAAKSGRLVVTASESGARVKLDDELVGTTPLGGPLEVPAGPHYLALEKDGFVTFQRQVKIEPAATTAETATLVPSPDYIKAYVSRESKLRMGAWLTTALAVAGLGGGGGLLGYSWSLYGTFKVHKAKLDMGVEADEEGNHRARAEALQTQIGSLDLIAYVALGVGGAAALAAVVMWIIGEDPHRYSQLQQQVTVGVAPAAKGGSFTLQGSF